MNRLILSTIVCIVLSGNIAYAEDKIAEAVKSVVKENLQATQAEDMDRMMKTIHTLSPSYLPTKQKSQTAFDNYDLRYKLLSFSYIGSDGEYAVVRIKQTTTKVSGLAFHDNELDLMQVFRKEKGKWKLWTQSILDIKYINK